MKLYYYDHAWKVHTYNIMFFEKKGCHDKAIRKDQIVLLAV